MSDVTEPFTGIAAILGAWLMAIPVLVPGVIALDEEFALWNYLLVGAGIALTSGYAWWAADRERRGVALASAVSGVLGLWLVLLPFYTDAVESGWLPWNDLAVGVFVAVIGLYNAVRAVDLGIDLSPSTTH